MMHNVTYLFPINFWDEMASEMTGTVKDGIALVPKSPAPANVVFLMNLRRSMYEYLFIKTKYFNRIIPEYPECDFLCHFFSHPARKPFFAGILRPLNFQQQT